MPDHSLVDLTVEMAGEITGADPTALGQKPQHLFRGRRWGLRLASGVELNPVAGGEQHEFTTGEAVAKAADRLDRLLRRKGQPLAEGQRYAAMGGAEEGKRHGLSSSAAADFAGVVVTGAVP